MHKLFVTYKIVTPLFLGGADPNEFSELRAPSIKGVMRFWYRAIDPGYRKDEARLFGGTGKGEGQSLFLLRVHQPRLSENDWKAKERQYRGFNMGNGTHAKNGMRYLSFSLAMKPNFRKYIAPGKADSKDCFTLELLFRKRPENAIDRRRIVSALWLLGHVGGLGSRSRRGFGSIALHKFESDDLWPEAIQLAPANDARTVDEWREKFLAGLAIIKEWFPRDNSHGVTTHTVLNDRARFFLCTSGYSGRQRNWVDEGERRSAEFAAWEEALNAAGLAMQEFRQRRTIGNPASDYERVKAHICFEDARAKGVGGSLRDPVVPKRISGAAPERTAFGLPLAFRYSSLKYERTDRNGRTRSITPNADMSGVRSGRSASPILIKIVEVNGKCYPLFVWLCAPLLELGEKVKVVVLGNESEVNPPPATVLDEFWATLKDGESLRW